MKGFFKKSKVCRAAPNFSMGRTYASKGARTVREGAVGNVITTFWMWITRAGRLPHAFGRRR
jgi:hypothetical protein